MRDTMGGDHTEAILMGQVASGPGSYVLSVSRKTFDSLTKPIMPKATQLGSARMWAAKTVVN